MKGRLGAVGTLILDRIVHPSTGGVPVEQLGGAAYSLAALSAACPAGWSIEPIVKVGADLIADAGAWLRELPNVLIGEGVRTVAELNNRVELRYHDEANRCEMLTGGVPPWRTAELLHAVAGMDALYVNLVSGMEMALETAQSLRAAFGGPIYADLHSLFLGPPGHGPRRPRMPDGWESWLGCFDTVQMNERELSLLGVPIDRIGDLLRCGPSIVVVTRGPEGASFAAHAPGGGAVTGHVPLAGDPIAGDPTGCGDVWGATLCAALLAGTPLTEAMGAAHAAAGARLRNPRVSALHLALASSTPRGGVLP